MFDQLTTQSIVPSAELRQGEQVRDSLFPFCHPDKGGISLAICYWKRSLGASG